MIRIKIVKPHQKYSVGEVVFVSKNEAHGLIDTGFGIISKDMTPADYKTQKVKRGRTS